MPPKISNKQEDQKPITEEEYLKSIKLNPLADYSLQIKVNNRKIQKKIKDTSLGDHIGLEFVGIVGEDDIYINVDLGEFNHSKMITTAANRNLILGLTASSQKLLLWIIYAIKFRSDVVELDLSKMTGPGFEMSRNSFAKSIVQLEGKDIIRRVNPTAKGSAEYWMFFINPQIIFKGNAKKFYNDVIKYHPDYKK